MRYMFDQLERPMFGSERIQARPMTDEEWAARKAKLKEQAEDRKRRTSECAIEDVQPGDSINVSWPGDGEGLSGGWHRVKAIYPWDKSVNPLGAYGKFPVLVLLDEHGMEWGPVYEMGDKVQRMVPK